MKNTFKIWFLVLVFSINYTLIYSQSSCKAELEFFNNTSSKKAGESGTYYRMKLINKSNVQTFNINVNNVSSKKQLNVRSKKALTVDLSSKITSDNRSKLKRTMAKSANQNSNQVILNRNEEFIFYVRLSVPRGSSFGSVNKSVITITSNNCTDFRMSKEITTEIIDGE